MSYLVILKTNFVLVVVFPSRFGVLDGFGFAFLWILRCKCEEGNEVMQLDSMRKGTNGSGEPIVWCPNILLNGPYHRFQRVKCSFYLYIFI